MSDTIEDYKAMKTVASNERRLRRELAGPGPRGGETVIAVQNGWYETWIEGQSVRLPVWQRWTTQ